MLNQLKLEYPNVYILILSIAIGIWFHTISTLCKHYIVGKYKIPIYILMSLTALTVIFMDDFSLSELYSTRVSNVAGSMF